MVFTPQLLRCLHTNLKNPASHLHAMAKRCVTGMSSALTRQGNPAARAAIAVALQRSGSSVLQALHKGSKGAVAPLLAELDAGALEQYKVQLVDELTQVGASKEGTSVSAGAQGEEDDSVQTGPAWAVEQLYAITRMPAADAEQRMRVMELLAANAFAMASTATVRLGDDVAMLLLHACGHVYHAATVPARHPRVASTAACAVRCTAHVGVGRSLQGPCGAAAPQARRRDCNPSSTRPLGSRGCLCRAAVDHQRRSG